MVVAWHGQSGAIHLSVQHGSVRWCWPTTLATLSIVSHWRLSRQIELQFVCHKTGTRRGLKTLVMHLTPAMTWQRWLRGIRQATSTIRRAIWSKPARIRLATNGSSGPITTGAKALLIRWRRLVSPSCRLIIQTLAQAQCGCAPILNSPLHYWKVEDFPFEYLFSWIWVWINNTNVRERGRDEERRVIKVQFA